MVDRLYIWQFYALRLVVCAAVRAPQRIFSDTMLLWRKRRVASWHCWKCCITYCSKAASSAQAITCDVFPARHPPALEAEAQGR